MKKIRITLMTVAIVCSISAALATKTDFSCTYAPQYYKVGSAYLPAGEWAYDYICAGLTGVCTYYKPNPIFMPNYYAPCRAGEHLRE